LYKCLRKKPEDRFINGIDLHEFIVHNSIHSSPNINPILSGLLQDQSEKLQRENVQLQQQLISYREQLSKREKELTELQATLKNKENEFREDARPHGYSEKASQTKGVSRTAFIALLLLTIGLAAFSAFSYLKNSGANNKQLAEDSSRSTNSTSRVEKPSVKEARKSLTPRKKDSLMQARHISDSIKRANKKRQVVIDSSQIADGANASENANNSGDKTEQHDSQKSPPGASGQYKAISKAYFYTEPDESTRREAFINKWNSSVTATDDMNGFIYVVYKNEKGQTTRGWLLKKDLIKLK
jgi:serine/threonine-protein kinase